jgi:hypothetical protein
MRTLLLSLLLIATLVPAPAHAGFFGPIVPVECKCDSVPVVGATGSTPPTSVSAPAYGCVLQALQNVVRVVIAVAFVLVTLAFVYAGFVWMTSAGNPGKVEQGKHLLLNTLLGMVLILGAWLLIDFVMKTVYREGSFGPWNNILAGDGTPGSKCLIARNPTAITSGQLTLATGPVTGDTAGGGGGAPPTGAVCPNGQLSQSCAIIGDSLAVPTYRGVPTALGRSFTGCTFNAEGGISAQQIIARANTAPVDWAFVSAGSNDCFTDNTCRDISSSLASIRSQIQASYIVWVLPLDGHYIPSWTTGTKHFIIREEARSEVRAFASQHGDGVVEYDPLIIPNLVHNNRSYGRFVDIHNAPSLASALRTKLCSNATATSSR